MDKNGAVYTEPRFRFLGLLCSKEGILRTASSLEEAVVEWLDLSITQESVSLIVCSQYGYSGDIVSSGDMAYRYGTPKGTYKCPICIYSTPHQHTDQEVTWYREDQVADRVKIDKRWEKALLTITRLEEEYPLRTPLYAHPHPESVALALVPEEWPAWDEQVVLPSPASILIELARCVLTAFDDSEERLGEDGRIHVISARNFDDVIELLDQLEELPDGPDVGLVYSGPMKACYMLATQGVKS